MAPNGENYKYKGTRDNVKVVKGLVKNAPKKTLEEQLVYSKKESRRRSRGSSYVEYHQMVINEINKVLKK